MLEGYDWLTTNTQASKANQFNELSYISRKNLQFSIFYLDIIFVSKAFQMKILNVWVLEEMRKKKTTFFLSYIHSSVLSL